MCAEVKALAGKVKMLYGGAVDKVTGQCEAGHLDSMHANRIALRNMLQREMDNPANRFIVKRLDVYAPCAILQGVSLWDVPGEDRAFHQSAPATLNACGLICYRALHAGTNDADPILIHAVESAVCEADSVVVRPYRCTMFVSSPKRF